MFTCISHCLAVRCWSFDSESSLISEGDLVQLNVEKSARGKDLVGLSCLESNFCY